MYLETLYSQNEAIMKYKHVFYQKLLVEMVHVNSNTND